MYKHTHSHQSRTVVNCARNCVRAICIRARTPERVSYARYRSTNCNRLFTIPLLRCEDNVRDQWTYVRNIVIRTGVGNNYMRLLGDMVQYLDLQSWTCWPMGPMTEPPRHRHHASLTHNEKRDELFASAQECSRNSAHTHTKTIYTKTRRHQTAQTASGCWLLQ